MECNFNNQSLPIETALGVLWNIEEDVFTFKVNMKEIQRQEETCCQH